MSNTPKMMVGRSKYVQYTQVNGWMYSKCAPLEIIISGVKILVEDPCIDKLAKQRIYNGKAEDSELKGHAWVQPQLRQEK